MIELVQEQTLQTPTARALVRQAVDDLLRFHCHLLLRPALVDGDLIGKAVLDELQRRHSRYVHLDAGAVEARRLPLSLLAHFRIPPSGRMHDPLDALQAAFDDRSVIFVDGWDNLSADAQRKWLDLVTMWGRSCQRRQEAGLPTSVLFGTPALAPSLLAALTSDVRLNLGWWWGVPSALEVVLVCRATDEGRSPSPESAWREQLAASLASGDAAFLAHLWPALTAPVTQLVACIGDYTRRLGWRSDPLRRWLRSASGQWANGRHAGRASGTWCVEPPTDVRELWQQGLVYYSREHGCELHTAALVALGDQPALAARMWRGQASLILPRLDAVRHQVCGSLTQRHGAGWPIRWQSPESPDERDEVEKSPYACQWGYLRHLLLTVPQLRRENQLVPLATAAWNLRNDLAHGRPVEYTDFLRFVREAERKSD